MGATVLYSRRDIVIAVLLFISGTANRNSYGKAGLTGENRPWVCLFLRKNQRSLVKGFAEHGSHGSRLQMKMAVRQETRLEREKKGSTVRESEKDADHRDDTGENSRLTAKVRREKDELRVALTLTTPSGTYGKNFKVIKKI